jgi:hypothetical protein
MRAVKFLLFLAMACVIAGLYFHDKQQTAKLDAATAANADLTQQMANYQTAVYQLKTQLASMSGGFPARGQQQQPAGNYQSPLSTGGLTTHGLDESH